MEPLILIAIAILGAIILLPCIAIAMASSAKRTAAELQSRIDVIETEIRQLRHAQPAPEKIVSAVEKAATPAPPPVSPVPPAPVIVPQHRPPPLHHTPPRPAMGLFDHIGEPSSPKVAESSNPAPVSVPARGDSNSADAWEEFMGAKLFAWIGGLALFLGIAFFVKYSFDHNLIPPALRVAIGFAAGLGLVAGGLLMRWKENAVTAQTLCATGVVVLYAVTFACRSYYHFAFFSQAQTFGIMTLITAGAFLLSVRMDAMVVAILGIAGGFLTPVLLSTGQDNPLALFGYIALLDCGLLATARRQHWKALPTLGAIGTILTQIGWVAAFFVPERYALGNKILVAMAVLVCFQLLFLAAAWWVRLAKDPAHSPWGAALAVGCCALIGAFYFLAYDTLGHRPLLLCGYLFIVDLGLIGLSLVAERLAGIRTAAGVAAFLFLGVWTGFYLINHYLPAALGCYFIFGLLHTALPLLLQRIQKTTAPRWAQLFPAVSLALVMLPIFQFNDLSLLIWPFVLLMDALALLVAIVTLSAAPVLLMLVLTLAAIGGFLFQIPGDLTGLPVDLWLLGGFSMLFIVGGSWAARRITPPDAGPPQLLGSFYNPANLAVQIPSLSAIMPFLLLIMVIVRLPLTDPSPVFTLGLLLTIVLLILSKLLKLEPLPLVALIAAASLEYSWPTYPFHPPHPLFSLAWLLTFYGVFTAFPFLFPRNLTDKKTPWIASALAGPIHFYLVREVVNATYLHLAPGLLPALFAIPPLLGLTYIAYKHPAADPSRLTQLAFFGGVALFFITLIVPLQFRHEWITLGWALEGAALCWLFRRVPHPGVRLVGVGLLAIAFARLACNPFVLSYHARAAYPILNWYLYTYGLVALALFAAARLLAAPRNHVGGFNVLPFLYSWGAILLFLLVNIEIADFFSAPGTQVLTFDFYGNFARDMSYSIAWALFALFLLIIGLKLRNAPVRYAALGLLSVTVLKLFLHDLSELDQLYRIGAFIAVAVIAILASFLYQRFLAAGPEPANPH